ncbi:MAG TPA: glycosyltransferase family 4 protein [Anaerolineae bacterium]|nr:glycosyltransferase family 4 protein [Anaerolineae bacterium]
MNGPTIVMLLSNAYRPDPRVLKEACTLAKGGYQVTVIAWDREGKYPAEELARSETGQSGSFTVQRVQGVRSSYGAGLAQALRLPRFWLHAWRRLNRLRPAVVHCHDFDTLPPGWLWAKVHRRPVVYDAHEYYTELQKPRLRGLAGKVLLPLIGAAEQVLSRSAAAVVTVDERIASRYRNRRIVIVGHYPPLEFARAPVGRGLGESSPSPSLSLGGKGAGGTLVYAGRFSVDRGMVVIAEALQRLARQGLRPRLRLMGAWTSQTEEQAFWQAMAGMEKQVETVGWVAFEQVPAQLVGADVALAVLQPIERYVAALPVKLFEYMACGLPVIISDFPANRAVVAGADCGLLVDPTNVDAVAAAIARLLTDPAEACRLGQNGRRAFETQYNWQVLEQKLLQLYEELSRQVDR